jgi:lysophospholipase L1-like esterase
MKRIGIAVLVLLSSIMALVTPAQAAPPAQLDVVLIGDSYASAYGAGNYEPDTIGTCFRSRNGYGNNVAAALLQAGRLATFTNVACSGATTETARPQLSALNSTTDLVLVTIGGNNGRFGFGPYAQTCLQADCSGIATGVFISQLPSTGNQVRLFLRAIARLAPSAHIILVGYGEVLEPAPSVNAPVDPICGQFTAAEHHDIRQAQKLLDGALLGAAAVARWQGVKVSYLSPYSWPGTLRDSFANHSLCDHEVQWYNGIAALTQSGGDGSVFHGNIEFNRALANVIMSTI